MVAGCGHLAFSTFHCYKAKTRKRKVESENKKARMRKHKIKTLFAVSLGKN